MNDCPQASRLSAYHDGELAPAQRVELEAHLRLCSGCAAELEQMAAVTRILAGAAEPEMPPGLLERVHRALDARPPVGLLRLAETLAAVAAVVLVACMIGLVAGSPAQGSSGGMPDVWDAQAMAQQTIEPASGAPEEVLANWMVQDLVRGDDRD